MILFRGIKTRRWQWCPAIKYAKENNCLIVISESNHATSIEDNTLFNWYDLELPSAQEFVDLYSSNVILVSGINRDKKICYAYGNVTDIVAPSKEPPYIDHDDQNVYNESHVGNGTSFGAPLVSGAAALLWMIDPTFTPAQVKSYLLDSGLPINQVVGDNNYSALPIPSLKIYDAVYYAINKTIATRRWYKDFDSDGYSDGTSEISTNRPGDSYYLEEELKTLSGDTKDSNPNIYPGEPSMLDTHFIGSTHLIGQHSHEGGLAIAPNGTIFLCIGDGPRLQKYDPSGELLWDNDISDVFRFSHAIKADESGNIYVLGSDNDSNTNLTKYNTSGDQVDQFIAYLDAYTNKIAIDSDGNIYFGSNHNPLSFGLYKIDQDLNEIWHNYYLNYNHILSSLTIDKKERKKEDNIYMAGNSLGQLMY